MGTVEVLKSCELDRARHSLVRAAIQQMDLSARTHHRVLKLAPNLAHWPRVAVDMEDALQ